MQGPGLLSPALQNFKKERDEESEREQEERDRDRERSIILSGEIV
jgi:hypothetical protein